MWALERSDRADVDAMLSLSDLYHLGRRTISRPAGDSPAD
jgi:hypothetical protein